MNPADLAKPAIAAYYSIFLAAAGNKSKAAELSENWSWGAAPSGRENTPPSRSGKDRARTSVISLALTTESRLAQSFPISTARACRWAVSLRRHTPIVASISESCATPESLSPTESSIPSPRNESRKMAVSCIPSVVLVSCQLAILEKWTNRIGPHWRFALAKP